MQAPDGLYRLITEGSAQDAISRTTIANLDIVVSDDPQGSLKNWVLHTPDARVGIRHALKGLSVYDIVLVATQCAAGPCMTPRSWPPTSWSPPSPPEILSA